MKGFIEFIREQGIIGLAIAFILGAAVSEVVNALVEDIINPILSPILGLTEELSSATVNIGRVTVRWGHFLSVLIDFVIVALVIYFIFKGLNLETLDKKKDKGGS